jgi:dTDP-4-amino-4,6-dideoxygalactose transaminase
MDPIMEIAQDHNLKVIEDAACAFGAKYKGKFAGVIGDIGCFSFHARKGITTGEGGMVVTANEEVAEKVRQLSVFGMQSAWDREKSAFTVPIFTDIGFNYKMSDITAAVGVAQLQKLERIINKKQGLAKYWDEQLEKIDGIQPPYVSHNCTHIYQTYVALVDKRIDRNKVIELLKEQGIQTQIGTYSSIVQPVYRSKDRCPNSVEVFQRALALPMYYMLREEDIDIVALCVRKTLNELR